VMELAKIRLVRADVSIWLVYAGRQRRYWENFRQSNCVFLQLPGFNASEAVFQSDEQLRRHLAMSDQIFRWVVGARNSPPSRNAASYNPYPYQTGTSEAKGFAAELGNVERMFIDARPGDLVLSPSFGHFDPYLIGEITKNWSPEDNLEIPSLENEVVPTRKVRWLNTALARRDFPPRISRRLQNQLAITKLDSEFYEEILQLVYPSFVWGGRSKLDIYGDDYSGTDPLQPYAPALLIKYVLASVFAYESGQFVQFQSLSPHKAIDQFYRKELIEHFGQNFNSPGKYSVVAALGSMSILATAGMLVATSDPSTNFGQVQTEVKGRVKDSMQGAGKAEMSDNLDGYVDSMEAVNWKDVQKELGKPAKESMTLSMNNAAEVANHRAELNAR